MPKRRRFVGKRRFRKRRRRTPRSLKRRGLVLGGFPKSKMVKLRYVEQITLNPGAGLTAAHVFRANSLYDPNSSGVGHQPANFDRWSNIYDHYTVIGSRIKVQFIPDQTTSYTPGLLGVALTDSGSETSSLTAQSLLEKRLVKSNWRSVGSQTNGSGYRMVKHNFSAKKFFGKPYGSIINDGTYRGKMGNLGSGSDPTEGAFFEIFLSSINSNDPASMPLLVTIDYIAILNEPQLEDES